MGKLYNMKFVLISTYTIMFLLIFLVESDQKKQGKQEKLMIKDASKVREYQSSIINKSQAISLPCQLKSNPGKECVEKEVGENYVDDEDSDDEKPADEKPDDEESVNSKEEKKVLKEDYEYSFNKEIEKS